MKGKMQRMQRMQKILDEGKMQSMKKYILLLTLVKKKARVAKLISDKINFRGTKIIRIKKGIT